MRPGRLSILPALAAALLAAAGCGGGRPAGRSAPAQTVGTGGPTAAGEQWLRAETADRLLIRRASIALEVDSLGAIGPRITALATSLGGYVARSAQTADHSFTPVADDALTLTFRVPASALDATLDSLARMGRVTRRTVASEDVTEQVVDVEARLASLIAVRDRLRQHLERAGTVGDVVAVERELGRVQAEIDALQSRQKHLRGSVAMAEVTVEARRRRVLGPLGLLFSGVAQLVGKLFVLR